SGWREWNMGTTLMPAWSSRALKALLLQWLFAIRSMSISSWGLSYSLPDSLTGVETFRATFRSRRSGSTASSSQGLPAVLTPSGENRSGGGLQFKHAPALAG